ncbi:tol-pal system protein YbgF [Methylocella silvestris BL2]|uniref:Cell division coordinator CpoB n=1 Tax=Methylocella silvestris (strain DSM 15510 / CIP 108128 / LMG 27833 / NCIMB 13906 / BL2) TaxID=395965 RepID=B8ER04_METSB|nr:tol-pal system protein YbgF [Methylocella silvestris]ACK49749.1 tol-pal system protein YbgF [Methylocella silvestris BL2]
MRLSRPFASAGAAALICLGSLFFAGEAPAGELRLAQNYRAPPADVGGDPYGQQDADPSSVLVRVDRLEAQLRQLNGQIEQLQFQNRKLEDQLRKFQEDVDFRFQDSGRGAPAAVAKPQKRTDAIDDYLSGDNRSAASGSPATPSAGATAGSPPAPARAARRGDAFDPSADPAAPGAPRPLGSAASAAPPPAAAGSAATDAVAALDDADGGAPEGPLNLAGAKWRAPDAQTAPSATPAPSSGPVAALATPNALAPGAAPINPVKEEFDVAYGYLRQKQYEAAEKSFAAFIQKNPKSRYSADATYYLGESFFQRSRPREAAEQYLKISTQYATSARAPEAMLRLGQSLNSLGAKEQACATFAEIGRKYPNAPGNVKAGADREAKRVQC